MSAPSISVPDVERAVLKYLRQRGFTRAEQILQEEMKTKDAATFAAELTDSAKQELEALQHRIALFDPRESVASAYERSYEAVMLFVEQCLDSYRNEMVSVLYPLFVYSYLDLVQRSFPHEAALFMAHHRHAHLALHANEIDELAHCSMLEHLHTNEMASLYRANKMGVDFSEPAYQLLMSYLTENRMMLMLKIIAEHVRVRLVPTTQPLQLTQPEGNLNVLMSQQVDPPPALRWGTLSSTASNMKLAEVDLFAISTLVHSQVPAPEQRLDQQLLQIENLRACVRLSATSLPSVAAYTFLNASSTVTCISISADGSLIATGGADGVIRLWNMRDPRAQMEFEQLQQHDQAHHSENPKPDAMEVDAGGESRSSESGAFPMPHTRLIGHQGTVYSVCFAPAKFLLSAGDDATVRLWSLETSLNVMVYKGHTFPVWDVCFSPVGSYFASASLDRTARIWVTDKASPLRILAGHHADVERCRFHPNGNYLATCSSDKSMRLWDVASGECVRIFLGHAAAVVSLVMSPSGLTAATGDSDGRVIIWDLNSGKSLKVCSSQTKTKQSNAAGAQADDQGWIARYLAAGATAESPAHTQSVTALSFSADGAVLASGSLDCSIKLWSCATGQAGTLMTSLQTKSTPIRFLNFTPRNLLLASGVFTK